MTVQLIITEDHPNALRHAAMAALGLPTTLNARVEALRAELAAQGLRLEVTSPTEVNVPAQAPEAVAPYTPQAEIAPDNVPADAIAPAPEPVSEKPKAKRANWRDAPAPEPVSEKPKATRAKKDKAAPAPAAPSQTDIEDFTGDTEHRPDLADPLADGDEAPAAAGVPVAAPPVSTGKEQEEALVLLQTAYAKPNGPAKVKELQVKYGVTRFVNVPPEQHAALLADAKAVLKAVGG